MIRSYYRWIHAGLLAVALAAPAAADLAPDAGSVQPLRVGDRAPDFEATRVDGTPYHFSARQLAHPQVLVFYRGGWCPFCNTQLADLRTVEPKLRAAGFEVLFLSTDRPELLYSSLEARNRALPYTLLSDSQLRAAQAFHIAYHLDDALYAKQLEWGTDLEKTTGTRLHALPVPSVFILDREGIVRYVYSNPDFRIRLGASDLWSAAQPLASPGARDAAR